MLDPASPSHSAVGASAEHAAAPASVAAQVAEAWYAGLADRYLQRTPEPYQVAVPEDAATTLAAFAALTLERGKSLLLLLPNDEALPAISNALDLALRPLCLVLPGADFAARIALRATLSLLKSRLWRDGDDEQTAPWNAQRERLKPLTPLWNDAQRWNAANDRSHWPHQVAQLFPVRILPLSAFRALPPQHADITLSFDCRPDTAHFSGWQLQVGTAAHGSSRHDVQPVSEDYQLQIELAQLSQDVAELELELATAQGEMSEFTHRYYGVVGRRLSELDVLRAKLAKQTASELRQSAGRDPSRHTQAASAEREADTLHARAERSRSEEARFADAAAGAETAPAFRPGQDIKRMFRQLAQKIHPDRATDEANRAWRTQLMCEANRAYRSGDADALREISELWNEHSNHPVTRGSVTPASGSSHVLTLHQQIKRLRARFAQIKQELNQVFGSKLYELFLAARQATRFGRDLLTEMADRLDQQIADTLAALQLARS